MNTDTIQRRRRLERIISAIVLLLLLGSCLLILRPFVSALLWAAVLCFSTWPIYKRVLPLARGHRTLAASVMALAMVLVVLLPFGIIAAAIGDNIRDLTVAVRGWIDTGFPPPPDWLARIPLLGHRAVEHWQTLAADHAKLLEESRRLIEPLTALLLIIGKALVSGLVALALSVLIALFFFRDGESIAQNLTAIVERVAGTRGQRLLVLAGATVRGVVYGILGTALVQGVMAGVGFLIAGVPGAGMLALLTFFLSVVPVGPPLIWVPAMLWLFHEGSTGWGLFMLVWGIGVSSVDNVVKPWLISQGSDMPFLLILFGVLGGALAFGFIGVFLGPTLLAVGYRLVTEWAVGTAPISADKP
ncbi:MAG TPA: AI-2E family transporter [Chthoniobacterales bacterium]|jgi:predicted PurR-regulated permease PerM|nr:AI-2E family transporter [Chthoniobacterales bacterium]